MKFVIIRYLNVTRNLRAWPCNSCSRDAFVGYWKYDVIVPSVRVHSRVPGFKEKSLVVIWFDTNNLDVCKVQVDAAQKFMWMSTENQHTPTVISISFPVTLCATKDRWSTLCWKEQTTFRPRMKEDEKKRNESKPFCEITTIPCLLFETGRGH